MPWSPPLPGQSVVILSGAGLSAASGVPTFRGAGGWWQGWRATDLATPEAWARDPDLVRAFYDMRRQALEAVRPNAGHLALVRLQAAWGTDRVVLVTQNVDGLLQRAADELGVQAHVIEMHGGLSRLCCSRRRDQHPLVPVVGAQDPQARCEACHAPLRPDIVWFGEIPQHMDEIGRALGRCALFLSVGTSGVVYPAAGFVDAARRVRARCLELNPEPTGGAFHATWAVGAEESLPRLVEAWLEGRAPLSP